MQFGQQSEQSLPPRATCPPHIWRKHMDITVVAHVRFANFRAYVERRMKITSSTHAARSFNGHQRLERNPPGRHRGAYPG